MEDFEIINGDFCVYYGKDSHVVIPDGVTKISAGVFSDCKNLTSVEIPNSVTKIGNDAFAYYNSLKSINIPNSVKSIGYRAFEGCTSLTSINIPSSVKSIGKSVFAGCTSLTSIDIPNSVTSIGDFAFFICENLKSITIPSSVTYIGSEAFDGITKVKSQWNANGTLRAFKAFEKDWSCRCFQYEMGKSFHQNGNIRCCGNGFHTCLNPLDVFNYYCGDLSELRFAEVELSGEFDFREDKVAASGIKIIREVTTSELAEIYNKMEKA